MLTLETIVEKLENDMAPYAIGLAQHLSAAFWKALAAEVRLVRLAEQTGQH